ncbi:MAG: glycine cleavage system aminomethyltransferase GcvT [Ignavibacteria bacterium]|jgi:aminomethyltransferase|nr:glycine cleavage system aminomethyltransferase GcvT [Ignavibacteria bacterium]
MKKTIFNELHKEKNAKMVQFAGFEMPIQYPKGIIFEHKAVRNSVGVFDVSHMGEFIIEGKDALDYLQKLITNDASKLAPGKIQYAALCLENGGIIDDLLVYKTGEQSYMLVVNGANIDKDYAWCEKNLKGFDATLRDESDQTHLLAVQGPKSIDTLQKLTKTNLSDIAFYSFEIGKLADVDMILSRTGYTGEIGFELYFKGDFSTAKKVWEEIFKAGEEFGIEAVGLGCRDTLRLEKGFCLYGNDIDENTNPLEAGLGWITKLNKGEFNGREAIQKVKDEGLKRKLIAFSSEDKKFIPRHNYKIFISDQEVGMVTSGNSSPILSKPIGLGYVKVEHSAVGTEIQIEARGKHFPAEIVKLPFV